jgi:hypothetical protein
MWFRGLEETTQHLFFNCHVTHVTRFLWNALFIIFNFQPPKDTTHLFGSWLNSFARNVRNKVIVGLIAMCWALWLSRNDAIFNRTNMYKFLLDWALVLVI